MSTVAPSDALPVRRKAPLFAAHAIPAYSFLAAAVALLPIMLSASGLRIAADQFGVLAVILAFIVWTALCLRGRGFNRVATALEAFAVFYAIATVCCLVSFILATTNLPFVDAELAAADRIILPGFDWPAVMLEFSSSGWLLAAAKWSYQSIAWQPQLLTIALCAGAQFRQVWQFVLSWNIALCIAIAIFAFCPALGPYTHFGIPSIEIPGNLDAMTWNEAIIGLRTGTLHFIQLNTLDGLVTFPSFHAAAAVLLGYAFRDVRLLRLPFVALNAVMFASAVPIGGHYVIDLIGGAIVAAAGIMAARKILDRIQTADPQR